MKAINENTIRKIVANVLREALEEKAPEMDYNPDWEESMDDIMAKFKDDETYDDSKAGGDYQIDFRNPYFFTKSGEKVDADAIGNFHNDFAIVKKDGKVNYVDSDGTILSDDWFSACNDFEDGFGMVSNGMKRNFIGSDGQLLLDTWVDRAGDFIGGTAPIIIDGERHEVDRNGNIM